MGRKGEGGAPQEMGGCSTRLSGSPAVFHTEINSNTTMSITCNPNDVKVVQLLCVRWAQDVSNILSANMGSSSENVFAAMDTT
jgi:hypothetical protein